MPIAAFPAPPSRDDPVNFPTRGDAFFGQFPLFVPQANALEANCVASAQAAAASAASALAAPGTFATSTTSLTIGAGSKTLAVQANKTFVVGQFVTIAQTSAPGNWMAGQITAYTAGSGSMTVAVLGAGGGGTAAAWTVGLSSPMQFFAALAANIWQAFDNTLVVTPAGLFAAMVPQALADAATITPDFSAGINFTLTLGGNRTLANPLYPQPGAGGVIVVTQDGTGGRSLAFGSAWKFPSGAPVLSNTAGATDVISYFVVSSALILCTLTRNLT